MNVKFTDVSNPTSKITPLATPLDVGVGGPDKNVVKPLPRGGDL